MLPNFCRINICESIHRSTQFEAHDSSLRSRVPEVKLLPAMHFLKQVSLREWTAITGELN
jgi:hypothetical protein